LRWRSVGVITPAFLTRIMRGRVGGCSLSG
jgi:hypothetical protein